MAHPPRRRSQCKHTIVARFQRMLAKLQSGQSIKQVQDWAEDQVEGVMR